MKKSYMNIKNLLSEGFFSKIAKFLRSKPKEDRSKKNIVAKGMGKEINNLNKSVSKLDKKIKSILGHDYPDLPKFTTDDFLD